MTNEPLHVNDLTQGAAFSAAASITTSITTTTAAATVVTAADDAVTDATDAVELAQAAAAAAAAAQMDVDLSQNTLSRVLAADDLEGAGLFTFETQGLGMILLRFALLCTGSLTQ